MKQLNESALKHTKTPWKINYQSNPTNPTYCTIYSKIGDHTTVEHITQLTQHMGENWQENARYIVHCVNSHDKLVGALKEIQAMAERRFSASTPGLKETDSNLDHIVNKCKYALNTMGE